MSLPGPAVAIIVATRNRAHLLLRFLRSLDVALAHCSPEISIEIIVVDNGSTDTTPQLVEEWCAGGTRRHHLHVSQPGKSRALNAALQAARGTLLLFTDDDVELAPDWIDSITMFFEKHPEYAAAMGCIRTPKAVTAPGILARVALYGTLPLYDRGAQIDDTTHLYGCNMAIRRNALDRVGPFHEELGPGASGLHEDGDLARRLLQAELRIGYMPGAMVYHAVEEDRLTMEFFREMHRRDARSRLVIQCNRSMADTLLHWLGAAVGWTWWSLCGNRKRRMKALGRLVSHREMLRLLHQRNVA